MNRRHYAITLQQASAESPTLAMLTALTKDSSERLKAIEPLLPAGLRDTVRAGPIEGATWCLLVKSNSAAAKLLGKYCLHCRLICESRGGRLTLFA